MDSTISSIWEESSKYSILTDFLFMDCANVTDAIINTIQSVHPSLQTLQIANQLSPQTALHLVTHTEILTTFDTDGIFLNVLDVISILQCQPRLKTLSIPAAFCGDQDLEELIPFFSKLQYLMLEETDITSMGIDYMKEHLPNVSISY